MRIKNGPLGVLTFDKNGDRAPKDVFLGYTNYHDAGQLVQLGEYNINEGSLNRFVSCLFIVLLFVYYIA